MADFILLTLTFTGLLLAGLRLNKEQSEALKRRK